MYQNAKIQRLSEIIIEQKLSRKDKAYIYRHLIQENQEELERFSKQKRPKTKEETYEDAPVKKAFIAVFDRPDFTSELAVNLAKKYTGKRIALLDADRLSPSVESYINAKSHIKNIYSHLSTSQSTGLNLLLDGYYKQLLSRKYLDHIAIRSHGYRNLFYFSGSYRIEDYEYFKMEGFLAIIDALKKYYDVLIVQVNGFIYDAFTCMSLLKSDINLIPLEGKVPQVKNVKKQIDFLVHKQDLLASKNYYILYNHHKSHIKESLMKDFVKEHYLGNIPYHSKRDDSILYAYSLTRQNKNLQKKSWDRLINKLMKEVDLDESR